MSLTQPAQLPLRHPNTRNEPVMNRRSWWLVLANFLLPGAAQALAGSRRLGRFGIGCTLLLWLLAIIAAVLWFVNRTLLINLVVGNSVALLALQVLLGAYVVLWIVLTIDTLRLVRLVHVAPGPRFVAIALALVLLALAAVPTAYGVYAAGVARSAVQGIFGGKDAPPVSPVDGAYNILLLGGDEGDDRDGVRPDSMNVLSVNASTGQATLIGLPRDLENVPFAPGSVMAKHYPDGYNDCDVDVCKLNSIYTEIDVYNAKWFDGVNLHGRKPQIEGVVEAAEGITGLKIQYYAMIEMGGFKDLVDAIGGVDIDVEEPVGMAVNGTPESQVMFIPAGRQHLDGDTALWYARSRYNVLDFDRMERQAKLQEAILQKLTPQQILAKLNEISEAGQQIIDTDVPQSMIGEFVELGDKARKQEVRRLSVGPAMGIDIDNPDFDSIRRQIAEALHPAEAEKPKG